MAEIVKTAPRPLWWATGAERDTPWGPPPSPSLPGGILILSAGFVLLSTVVFLSNPEISFFELVSEDLGEIFEQGEPG